MLSVFIVVVCQQSLEWDGIDSSLTSVVWPATPSHHTPRGREGGMHMVQW